MWPSGSPSETCEAILAETTESLDRRGIAELRDDRPADAARILQPGTGYLATIIGGMATRVDDQDTGARPGRLVRGTAAT